MDKLLKRNICPVPDYVLNSEVADLQRRIEKSGIRGALEYACRSWHMHLKTGADRTGDVVSALRYFLETKFLFWLEVLSVLGVMGDAVHALNMTIKWLNEVCSDSRLACYSRC